MKKKIVLAFSGGLDTSYCVKYLSDECNYEVYTAIVNTGGFNKEELLEIEKNAYGLGVKQHKTIEATKQYYQDCIRFLVYGNVLKNNTYPLSVSAERVFQAIEIVKYAREVNADAVAHGSTGAGNDQVRFDLVFQVMGPELEIVTPIRDLKLSREDEVDYLRQKGVEKDWAKAKYSINKGLWGTSVGGVETLTSAGILPEEAYPTQLEAKEEQLLTLSFEKGELKGIDGEVMNAVEAIQQLEKIASPFAIGRDVHVGDTIIGIKGRVGFEAAAPLITIKAHHLLEKHVLTKWQQHWKEQLGNWYGMMLHEAAFLDPVMRNIEKFLEDTQEQVSGEVYVKLMPYRFEVTGINSTNDLMSAKFGSYGEMNLGWSGEDVKGFTKILSNQIKIFHQVKNQK
ncbi:MAG: argininosuccinate synthase domain-containing protein [Bacteroidota bacterium]